MYFLGIQQKMKLVNLEWIEKDSLFAVPYFGYTMTFCCKIVTTMVFRCEV